LAAKMLDKNLTEASLAGQLAADIWRRMVIVKFQLVASAVAVMVIVGGAVALLAQAQTSVSAAPASSPVAPSPVGPSGPVMEFPNDLLKISVNPEDFEAHPDPQVSRTGSEPATIFRNTAAVPRRYGGAKFPVDAESLRGKRVRMSAWVKTQNLARWAGLSLNVWGPDHRVDAADAMGDRPIAGTTDWQQYSCVVDVLADSELITPGVALWGVGTVWLDGFRIEIVGNDVPTTDDTKWHPFSWKAQRLAVDPADAKVTRNGHPTTRFSVARGDPPYSYYDRGDRHIEKYLGKKVRMTAWLKGEKITGSAGLSIHVNTAFFQKIADDDTHGKRPMRGTMDWKKYEATAVVPMEAQSIFCGLELIGDGTMWIDDVQVEVVE
jgi:hypothetical protein